MGLFYNCSECARKYKLKERLIQHMLKVHTIVDPPIGEPTENRARISKIQLQREKREKELEELRKEAETKERLDREAKEEAERIYKGEQLERYRLLEERKMEQAEEEVRLNEKAIELEREWLDSVKKIKNNVEKQLSKDDDDGNLTSSSVCCICSDAPADVATIPCGHKNFCKECIDDYRQRFPRKGCPICREDIIMTRPIFG